MSDGAGAGGIRDEGRLVAGRYRLLEHIGRGGMGTVWRAEDELLGRHVALKKLHVPPHLPDEERATLYERTRREARSAARITHPNVVVVHDVVDDGGLPCIVMEYVPSRTLGDVLKQDGPVTPEEAARIGRGMIAALRAAHAAGVLHRDVKPGNVLLGADGRVVLTDFGIAVASGTSTLTRTGELVGSVDYLAPERVKGGTPGPASDLWALGATLYQAVEGRPPFRKATAVETAYAIAVDPLEPPRAAGALAPLIAGLLEKDDEARPPAETVEQRLREPAVEAETAYVDRAHLLGSAPAETGGTAPTTRLRTGGPNGPYGASGSGGPDGSGGRGPAEPTEAPAGTPNRSGRPRGRRIALGAATVVVVAALAAGGTALALHSLDHGAQAARGAPPPSGAGASPAPEPSPVPDGYRLVEERDLGVSVPVPEGWSRKPRQDGSTIDYVDPTRLVVLKISVLDLASGDHLQHWRQVERQTEGEVEGYRRLRMQRTTYRQQPAAIWEFTFQGRARQFRAADLGFGQEGGKEYAIYLAAPSTAWARNKPVFDHALSSLRLTDG